MGRGDSSKANAMNQQAFNAGNAQNQAATAGEDASIDAFKGRLHDIFANNPYEDPTYQANIRSTAGAVESGAQNSAATKMDDYAGRTGENSENVLAAEQEGARDSSRRLHQTLTGQAVADENSRQQQLMQATSMLGSIPGMYGAQGSRGVSLMGGSQSSQTQLAGQPSWFDSLINAGVAAGGAVGAGFAGGKCWIAEAIYGYNDHRTHKVRYWLNNVFEKRPMGKVVMALYGRFGVRIARWVRASAPLRLALKPLFDLALVRAERGYLPWEASTA